MCWSLSGSEEGSLFSCLRQEQGNSGTARGGGGGGGGGGKNPQEPSFLPSEQ